MTNATQPKSIPTPALLVYGRPTSPDLSQASWFRAEDRSAVMTAARSFKFSVLEVQTDTEKVLAPGVHEGVLKSNGRMIVGSVTPEVYERIEAYAAKMPPGSAAMASSDDVVEGTKSALEQNMNIGKVASPNADPISTAKTATAASSLASSPGKPEKSVAVPDPWDSLRVGSHVAAKYWYSDGQANGWWIAVITAIEGSDLIIRWPDEPKSPPIKIERKHVAILHPAFDVKREWDPRR